MTTNEINEMHLSIIKELNKIKAYLTKLSKILSEKKIEAPRTNWREDVKQLTKNNL